MKTDPRIDEWRNELAALEAEDPFAAHEQAHAAVCTAMATYDAKKAELEDAGIAAVKRSQINSTVSYAKPLVPLRAALDKALAERRAAEAKCQRIDVLRKCIDAGSSYTPFRHYDAPKLTPAEARERGGRAIVVRDGVPVIERSMRAPRPAQTPPQPSEFAPVLAGRRAAGDAKAEERRATIEANRARKRGEAD